MKKLNDKRMTSAQQTHLVPDGDQGLSINSDLSDTQNEEPQEGESIWQIGMRLLGYGQDEEVKESSPNQQAAI